MAIQNWTATGPDWMRIAQNAANLRSANDLNEQRQAEAQREALKFEQAQQLAPLEQYAKQLALRGQILGPSETVGDYQKAQAEIQRLGLPSYDLPEVKSGSDAWKTFQKRPEPSLNAPQPSWLPEYFRTPTPTTTPEPVAMPTGPMRGGPDEVDLEMVQRAAERGLPLDKQARNQAQDAKTQAYMANLERNKALDDLRQRRLDFEMDAKRIGMTESAEQRKFNREMKTKELGIDYAKLDIERGKAGAQKFSPAIDAAMKGLPALRDEARTAVNGINTIDQMTSLLDSGAGARTGLLKTWLGRITGQQTEGMAEAELYQLLAETMRGPLRADIVGPGPMTEAEQRLLGQVTGGGTTGLTAARQLLAKYKRDAQSKVSYYQDQKNRLSKFDPSIQDVYTDFQSGQNAPTAPKPSAPAGSGQGAGTPQKSSGAPPARLLKEGVVTTFEGRGSWTLRNGVPTEVK